MQRLAELILSYYPSIYPFAILLDEKANAINGGTSSSTTWNARDLQTKLSDLYSLATISSNKVTLITGIYKINARSVFIGGAAASAVGVERLYNVTQAVEIAHGENQVAITNGGAVAMVDCIFVSNGTDEIRLDTWTTVGRATNGLGAVASASITEIYSIMAIEKVG